MENNKLKEFSDNHLRILEETKSNTSSMSSLGNFANC